MSFSSLLCHRCTSKRATAPITDDETGTPEPSFTTQVLSAQPCRLVETEEELLLNASSSMMVATRYKLYLKAGVDILPGDRVSVLTSRGGTATTVHFLVLRVSPALGFWATHHQTAYLQNVPSV